MAVFSKSTATNFLVGNFNSQMLDSVYGDAASVDCLIWAPQTDVSKINMILASEKIESNQSSCDVPVEQSHSIFDHTIRSIERCG